MAQGMEVRGHTLLWHNTVPSWLTNGGFTPAQMETIMNGHIDGMVGHYAGQVAIWDVVNEAFLVDGTLRSTVWSAIDSLPGGSAGSYIDKAFIRAHAADPNARLILNDYGAETLNTKSDGLYAFVQGMLARGVPIHGVGFQMHINVFGLDYASLTANLRRFSDLGLEIHITEMDVNVPENATQEMLDQQAGVFRSVLTAALQIPDFRSLTLWGVSDLHQNTSLNPGFSKALLIDDTYNLKPAYQALREELQAFALADADRDGLCTLWETLTGTDPWHAGSAARPTPKIMNVSGGDYFALEFPHPGALASGLTFEGSNTLASWTTLDTAPGGDAEVTLTAGTLTLRLTHQVGSPGSFKFLRARLSLDPP
jgi:endo-1,4-beta-xylanase